MSPLIFCNTTLFLRQVNITCSRRMDSSIIRWPAKSAFVFSRSASTQLSRVRATVQYCCALFQWQVVAMSFSNHLFISYAHIDNYHDSTASQGWIDLLHERLEIRLAQLL